MVCGFVYFEGDLKHRKNDFSGCFCTCFRTYNFAGKLHSRIVDAFNKGDIETARTEQVLNRSKGTYCPC